MLEVNGRLKTAGINELSDERYKSGITTLAGALGKLMQLRGTEYFWRTEEFPALNLGKEKQMGVIAQEVEKVLPELVHTDDDGYKAVDYTKMIPLLIEAIKEQEARLEKQEQQIQELLNKKSE